MKHSNSNQDFSAELKSDYSAEVSPSERQDVENTLGENAVGFKLNTAGFNHLFKTLAEGKA